MRAHLADPAVSRGYHGITRCVRRAFLLGEGANDRKARYGSRHGCANLPRFSRWRWAGFPYWTTTCMCWCGSTLIQRRDGRMTRWRGVGAGSFRHATSRDSRRRSRPIVARAVRDRPRRWHTQELHQTNKSHILFYRFHPAFGQLYRAEGEPALAALPLIRPSATFSRGEKRGPGVVPAAGSAGPRRTETSGPGSGGVGRPAPNGGASGIRPCQRCSYSCDSCDSWFRFSLRALRDSA